MLSNTLSIIEMTIQRKMNKNIDSIALTNFFKNYRKNMWIYPGVLKRKFSFTKSMQQKTPARGVYNNCICF